MQTWRQQGHLDGDDAQLAFLRLPRITTNTNDVTTAQFIVNMNEVVLRFVIPAWKKKQRQIYKLISVQLNNAGT